jgi:hypothetical protein
MRAGDLGANRRGGASLRMDGEHQRALRREPRPRQPSKREACSSIAQRTRSQQRSTTKHVGLGHAVLHTVPLAVIYHIGFVRTRNYLSFLRRKCRISANLTPKRYIILSILVNTLNIAMLHLTSVTSCAKLFTIAASMLFPLNTYTTKPCPLELNDLASLKTEIPAPPGCITSVAKRMRTGKKSFRAPNLDGC